MKVLFAYSNQVRDLLPAPPIGLSYVASATEDRGHETHFIDLLLTRKGLARLRRKVRSFKPDIVAISVRNIDNVVHQRLKKHLDELARQTTIVREESNAIIVVGGPAISILGCSALEHMDADFAVLGEGEQTFPDLLDQISGEKEFWRVPGICVRGQANFAEVQAQRSASFGRSGMERWVQWKRYERLGSTWPIQCKRGCPLHCTYCTYPTIEGRAMRRRSPAEIVEEIRHVQHTVRPRCFEFIDSVFNMPETYAKELCEEIIRAELDVNLTTMGVNPRFLSAELLLLMKRAGFNSLMITPESASDTVLETMRKGFTREDAIRCATLVRESGIPSMWFFMLGAPGETRDTAEETVSFAEDYLNFKNCLPMFTTGIRILPGTELARQAREQGYISPETDLAESVFYFSPKVSEEWLLRRVDEAKKICPAVVHAAEDPSGSPWGQWIHAIMHTVGISPPYWRFFPRFLSLPYVHRSRTRR